MPFESLSIYAIIFAERVFVLRHSFFGSPGRAALPVYRRKRTMRDSSLSPSSRLGGAVISDRIVSALLEELRTGRYAQTDRLPAEVDLAAELGVSRTVIRMR